MIARALLVFGMVAAAGIALPAAEAGSAAPRLSADSHYAFPVAAEVQHMTWTRKHWDDSNAVDLFAAPELSMESQEFKRFSRAPVVAVTSGTVRRADNERGGVALVLEGDDGLQYYYAHLSETAIAPGAGRRTVETGEQIGVIGKTGRWTRWIEPHLHFAVSTPEAESLGWQPDIKVGETVNVMYFRDGQLTDPEPLLELRVGILP